MWKSRLNRWDFAPKTWQLGLWRRVFLRTHGAAATLDPLPSVLPRLQPPYATAFPEIVSIYDDHPCVPVGNSIDDNQYCHRGSSPGKGLFIDKTAEQIRGWYSTISNNRNACP